MKTITTFLRWRAVWFSLLALLLQVQYSKGTATVNVYTDQFASGANWIEFRYMITNTSTAGETLYINAPGTWRLLHSASIVPAGTNTFTLDYVANTADPMFAPLYVTKGTTFNTSYTASTRLMQATFSSIILGPSSSATNAPVLAGQTVSGGKFRLTITNTNFVCGTAVGLAWSGTTTGVVAYVNTASVSTAMNTTTTRTLGTVATGNTPACCTVNVSGSSTSPSCYGKSDGTATATASGSSPFTYSWSNGQTNATATGLSAGTYTCTVTGSGGCTSTTSVTLTNPSQPTQPSLACYQSASWNSNTCQWDVTGTQPAAPTGLACWQTAAFNGTTCQWTVSGTQPTQPSTACYQTATFNN